MNPTRPLLAVGAAAAMVAALVTAGPTISVANAASGADDAVAATQRVAALVARAGARPQRMRSACAGKNGGMKWGRAVHHVQSLAEACADMATRPASIFPLRVTQMWAVGDILGPTRDDIEFVTVALCVDLPPDAVAWQSEPHGAQHWANATRLAKNPVVAWWRSAHAPVWNHRIDRPVQVWDETNGVGEEILAALDDGRGESMRPAAPSPELLRARLEEELAISLRALRKCTKDYEDRRWSPGKLEPFADALWRASDGYVDVLDALRDG